jgi:DNA-binding transcriptional LysR family regulator
MDEIGRIERRLKLHDLRVLVSVVQHGSMVKAAAHLGTSQPAVSRTITDLEHSLGVRLLDRSPQGLIPTPFGHALTKRSISVFDELRQGVKDLKFLTDPSSGEVRIASPVAVAAGFASAVIDRLARQHPRMVCHLLLDDPANDPGGSYRALEERKVDLFIARIVGPLADNLESQLLFDDPLYVVAAADNPWSRRRKVRLDDLMNEPWILPPLDTPLGAHFLEAFRMAGLNLPEAAAVSSIGIARIALVARGHFLTIASGHVFKFFGPNAPIKALPIDLSRTSRPIGIVTLKNRTLAPVVQFFIDCAHELARSLPSNKSV